MNELQKKEFDLLKSFVEICDKLDLNYFLVCGSALGAVKYNGFIPWDDDIDVGMFREDYEIFVRKASELLPDSYFLQNYKSDSSFPAIYSKLRDSSTAYIEKSSAKLPINHGIYIDIFPLDGYPSDSVGRICLEIKKKMYSYLLAIAFDLPFGLHTRIVNRIMKLLGFHKRTSKTAEKYSKCISKYHIENSELICNHGNWQGKLEYAAKKQYGRGKTTFFEGLEVRVPENYDEYLTQKYGDWRAELPAAEQVGHHYFQVCDTERSYLEYLNYLPDDK